MSNPQTTFSKDDVLCVANALISFGYERDTYTDSMRCSCCNAYAPDDKIEKTKHKITCPILVAKDLLTGGTMTDKPQTTPDEDRIREKAEYYEACIISSVSAKNGGNIVISPGNAIRDILICAIKGEPVNGI